MLPWRLPWLRPFIIHLSIIPLPRLIRDICSFQFKSSQVVLTTRTLITTRLPDEFDSIRVELPFESSRPLIGSFQDWPLPAARLPNRSRCGAIAVPSANCASIWRRKPEAGAGAGARFRIPECGPRVRITTRPFPTTFPCCPVRARRRRAPPPRAPARRQRPTLPRFRSQVPMLPPPPRRLVSRRRRSVWRSRKCERPTSRNYLSKYSNRFDYFLSFWPF